MNNFNFTKAYLKDQKEFPKVTLSNDVKKLEQIYENMKGNNPFVEKEEKNVVKQEQHTIDPNFRKAMDSLKQLKKD